MSKVSVVSLSLTLLSRVVLVPMLLLLYAKETAKDLKAIHSARAVALLA